MASEGGRLTRKNHRLCVRWDWRRRDMMADLTPRFGNADLRWILSKVFGGENVAELERRGYDLRTLRFHIDKTAEAIGHHEDMVAQIAAGREE